MVSRSIRIAVALLLLGLPCRITLAADPLKFGSLRAGAAAVDVSPTEFPVIVNGNFLPGTATRVIDPLHARCLVLDDGKTKVAICVVDSCVLAADLLDEVKAVVAKSTGIPPDRMLISATHAHSCPSVMAALGVEVDPHYPPLLKRKLVEAIEEANRNLAPAQAAWGIIKAPDYVGARRWIRRPDRMLRDPYGEISMRANMHPGYLSADAIGPSGPIDPDLTVLSVQTAEGRPLAVLANWGMHYFATGVKPISSDYYGLFYQKVAKLLNAEEPPAGKPAFVAMLSQGCSGDMWRVDYSKPKKARDITIDEFADGLARLAVEAIAGKKHRGDISLAMVEKEITVKARLADENRLNWARKVVAEMGDRPPRNQTEVLAREAIHLSQRPQAQMKLQAIRIGDFAIAAIPDEVYALTGLKLKAQCPLAATMVIELANDELGYIPPPEQHKLGGYTTWAARSSYTAVDTEPRMVETELQLLEQVAGAPRKPLTVPRGPYAAAVLESKPLAWFRMSEMSGPAAIDATGNGCVGTYEDGVVFFLEGPQSPAFCGADYLHRAAHFCGGRLGADVPAMKNARAGYSVEFWFWNGMAAEARPVCGYLFGRASGNDGVDGDDALGIGGAEQQAGVDATGRLFFHCGPHKPVLVGRTVIPLRTWNHVVLAREGQRATVYLNGGGEPEIIGDADALAPAATSQIYFGGAADKNSTLEGKIDEAAIYDRALQRPEIVAHFRASAIQFQPTIAPAAAHSNVTPTEPTPPDKSVARMHIKDGFTAELMVCEPLIVSPVAMAFGPDGKLWVIEMTEYPLGKHGTMDPSGRVIYLESTRNDGKYDKATVFAENLNFPNGIMPWRKGVIVTSAPDILYLEDTTGNGKADKKQVLYTGFTQGNPQLRINSPTYGLDNWVYLANGLSSRDIAKSTMTGAAVNTSNHDIRIRPDEGLIEAETGISQYGRHMDNWGNWFGVHNSYPVRSFVIPDKYANRNKDVQLPRGYDDAGLPPNPKVYPVSNGQKRYGYAFFEQSGHFTSACSMIPYRDDLLFPNDSSGATDQVFVCEPAHNLVQHLVLKRSGSTLLAERAPGEEFNEFLASEDGWSRPCFLYNAPDGAIWMVDIYRFFIDHPDFLPPEGKQDMRPYYRLGDNMGRIYRIFPKDRQPRPIPRLDKLDTAGLVAALDSPSGWQRDMAQMMLVWRKDAAAVQPLQHMVETSGNPMARMHALCTLDGLGKLPPATIERALGDVHPAVRRQAVRLCETYSRQAPVPSAVEAPQLIDAAVKLADDPDPAVRLQLAFSIGEWESPTAGKALAKIALEAGEDIYLSAAVMSAATNHYEAIADALIAANKASPLTRDLLAMALAKNNRDLAARLLAPVFVSNGGKYETAQLEAFSHFIDDLAQHGKTLNTLAASNGDALSQRLAQAAPVFEAARSISRASDAPVEQRLAAAALLGRDPANADGDVKLLASLLLSGSTPGIQAAAARALARLGRDDIPAILLHGWKDNRPEVRAAVMDAMLGREPWAYELLKRVEARDISALDIDPARRGRLVHSASARIRELADKTVGDSSGLSRTRVLENYRPVYDLVGDPARGAKVFAANCMTCHHLANMGTEIGPNLQSVQNWPADALMVAILDPSRSAEPRYLSYNCVLDTGETAYGLLVRESAAGVVMKGIDGKERTIPRRQIKSLECTNRSLMPDGLESAIDKQSMADLIKFLQTHP